MLIGEVDVIGARRGHAVLRGGATYTTTAGRPTRAQLGVAMPRSPAPKLFRRAPVRLLVFFQTRGR